MGVVQNIFYSLLAVAIAFGFQSYRNLTKPFPRPEVGKNISYQREVKKREFVPF